MRQNKFTQAKLSCLFPNSVDVKLLQNTCLWNASIHHFEPPFDWVIFDVLLQDVFVFIFYHVLIQTLFNFRFHMIWETFIQIIHQLSDFKYLAMIWVFSGNSLFIVRKLKIIYNHFKSLPCHLSLVIYSNGKISYFPIRSEGRYFVISHDKINTNKSSKFI